MKTDVAVEWLFIMLCIAEIPGLNLDFETCLSN
jgi:hypothetical protein